MQNLLTVAFFCAGKIVRTGFYVVGKNIIVFVDKSLKWKFTDNFFL